MEILIYQDYKHNNGVLLNRLIETFPSYKVRYVDSAQVLSENTLHDRVFSFVMPGGADLFYVEKLNGAGNDSIRKYVENGGCFFGICAGSYYACESIEWAKNEEDSRIFGGRQLKLFPGKAIGPIYDFIESQDFHRSHRYLSNIIYEDDGSKTKLKALYNGGPYFELNEGLEVEQRPKILARYTDFENAPAIVECKVGSGKAILSSPHIEYRANSFQTSIYQHQNASYERDQSIYRDMLKYDQKLDESWNLIIKRMYLR